MVYALRRPPIMNLLEGFHERLYSEIGISRPTDIRQLQSHPESSPPLILKENLALYAIQWHPGHWVDNLPIDSPRTPRARL